MKSIPIPMVAKVTPGQPTIAHPDVPLKPARFYASRSTLKQRGVVLFFTLVALLAMSLAVVALIRSVDTGAIIAGNLAFRQAATAAADVGIEVARGWLRQTNDANITINVSNNLPAVHPFNVDTPTAGYYSSLNSNLSLTDPSQPLRINWTDADSVLVAGTANGYTVRYVIQRMCRDANLPIVNTRCLYGQPTEDMGPKTVQNLPDICEGGACPVQGQSPMLRITARAVGPRNSVSYVQAFVY